MEGKTPFVSGFFTKDLKLLYKGVLFFLLLLFTHVTYAQSYYFYEFEVGYPQKDSVTCYVFLNIATDGTAVGRLRYIEPLTGADCLYQLDLADTATGAGLPDEADSVLFLTLVTNPINLQSSFGGGLDPDLILPRFAFKKTSPDPDSLYKPFEVNYQYLAANDIPGNWFHPVNTKIISLNEGNLSSDVVKKFYFEKDDLYQFLFKIDTRSIPLRKQGAKMHLICVAATLDSTIGVTSRRDVQNMNNLYSNLAKQFGIPFLLTEISGNDFSKEKVDQALANLTPGPKDIVIFYFSGHGFRFSSDFSRYPRMLFRTNNTQMREDINLGLEDVYSLIVKKGANVNLVMADCCNEDVGPIVRLGRGLLATKSIGFGRAKLNIKNAENLFFPSTRNNMIVASADKFQLAAGNPTLGGYFTFSFMSELERNLYTRMPTDAWIKILSDTRNTTRQLALRAICNKETGARCDQVPFFNK